ncbi:acetate/propionate family kinase [Rhodopila globiformis]|uniref:Acetate kinase n=1 Tax=Rhodopila globiformis TaxID=1071 RepID=A0A2S6NJH6_RHOGL|nr:acetate/propionate family kinase [Rhodopila globiformis]PPQ35019.1 acetate kinase [Rhodopila globiformis]
MSGCIAVINAGSSSIKFALCGLADDDVLYRGQVEGIGVDPRLRVRNAQGETIIERAWPAAGFGHDAAAEAILQTGASLAAGTVAAIGHRVVHGGMAYDAPVRLDVDVVETLSELVPLAPLHQPHSLAVIRRLLQVVPHIPQVACFDTAFHRAQPHLAQAFALPRRFSEAGIRRYGFHGLSYEYLVSQMRILCPALAAGRVIMAHLGNGASLCAVRNGRSVASTMGFTAADGLMMGTRCGALDPGVILHLMTEHGMDAAALEDLIYRKSGLLGVSGISPDMRTLRASTDPRAREAIDLFIYRIIREVGSLTAALGGVGAMVFAGGIGENDAATRAAVTEGCRWAGVKLDHIRNEVGRGRISGDDSSIEVWVIRTDEERMITRHTRDLLKLTPA